jgi:SAM-dependent methyltransferase
MISYLSVGVEVMTLERIFMEAVDHSRVPYPSSLIKSIVNFIGFPLRTVLLNEGKVERLGLTSLQEERINAVWPHLKGRVLDIGAGNNRLINLYQNGIGVEVYDWKGGALLVEDSSKLPFEDAEFDTVCFIACLNHIPNRKEALGRPTAY